MNKIKIKISHPPEWPTKTIYEACQIVSRGTAPVYVENSTVLAIGQRCIREFGLQTEEARFHDQRSMTRVLKACKRDVLLNSTGTGTIGRSCIFNVDGTYIIDGHVTLLRSDPDQLDGRWLNALLQSPQGQLHLETQCYSGSTNQVELSRERLSATSIPLPSLPEQRRIAEILDTIDEAIQKTEALISKLKAMKQGLLHNLLTCGLDENSKLRDPKAHPEQFKNSPLGRIPKEWDTVTIEAIGADKPHAIVDGPFGSNLKSIHYRKKGVPVIQSGFVTTGEFIAHEYVYVDNALFQAQRRSAVVPGDIVMAKIGAQCGTCAILPEGHPVGILAGNSLKISANPNYCRTLFLLRVLHRYYQIGLMDKLKTETAQPAISLKNLRAMLIPLPSLMEQDSIVSNLNSHDARIRTEEQYCDKLKLQKKGLMHDLLTGKVRVRV